ncbi:MAG TPA: hypothetical protein VGL66_06590 [Caulobacteraceae bacterium]
MGGDYPRIYRMTAGARRGATGVGLLLGLIGAAGIWSTLRPGGHPSLVVEAFGVVFILAGALIAANAQTARLVLREDELRVTHLFFTRAVRRDAVAGRKLMRPRWLGAGRYAVIDQGGRETQFPPNLKYDRAFHAYVDAFPKA